MIEHDDAYRGIARHYDLHGWDWYAAAYGDRLIALLGERGVGPGAAVLDLGSGTGTLALKLAAAGYDVTGVDLSPEMVASARSKDRARAVTWEVADITAMALGRTFDAIVSTADVFNHLETLDEWEAALRRARAHLRPGGIAFVDAMTRRGLARLDQQVVQEREGALLILAVIWEPGASRSTLKITSFAPVAGTPHYERAQETIAEWGQPVAGVLERVARAGFAHAERVFTIADDPEADERVAIVAW